MNDKFEFFRFEIEKNITKFFYTIIAKNFVISDAADRRGD